jgi:putative endonuclease
MTKQPAIYIMASTRNGTLYVGVTSNLLQHVWQHWTGAIPGFRSRYGCKLLVHFEMHPDMPTAIAREKQIKASSRACKLALIETDNPIWRDVYEEIL